MNELLNFKMEQKSSDLESGERKKIERNDQSLGKLWENIKKKKSDIFVI